jgi:rubrerythrin
MPVITAANVKTLENLLTAFEGESNASAKYTAFAAKADAEGWHGAASLFRAAGRAESIHAANHSRVIARLGGEAQCVVHPVEVKGTLENLRTALAGEQYEVETMYPDFIQEAQAQSNTSAVRSMQYALEAEKTHIRLYGDAIALVEAGKKDAWVGAAHDFYVCPTCGYTSETAEEQIDCPVCGVPWERFEVIR